MNMNALQILLFMNLSHMSCVRITDGKISCESFIEVKDSHVFVTSVKIRTNSSQVTNTCEFFTRLKLDSCEKLVPIKISKLVVRIFHTYQNVTYSRE